MIGEEELLIKMVREKLALKIESLGAVVFASDPKEREMLAKSVVLTVIRKAPLL